MGHGGMLYSLPSRDLIADSVEYMVNAHCADALVCISNCDKITPGMLMAAMRLNIPTIFVSGGPMEAGKIVGTHDRDGKPLVRKLDLIDSMIAASDAKVSDAELAEMERSACPTCGSCSGMFTANSMNCLNEALGLALPGNGTLLATHARRWELFEAAGRRIVEMAKRYYVDGDRGVLPRSIATFDAFENAMALDIAMGGSTNTVLHILAIAHEAGVAFTMEDIDRLSRRGAEHLQGRALVAATTSRTCTARAASSRSWASSIARASSTATRGPSTRPRWAPPSTRTTSGRPTATAEARQRALAAPGGVPTQGRVLAGQVLRRRRHRRREGLHPRRRARLQQGRRPGRAVRQHRRRTAAS